MQESDGQIYPHHPSPNLILAYKLTALLQHYVCLKDLVVLAVQILALAVPLIWNDQLLPHREHACSSSQAQFKGHLIHGDFLVFLKQALSSDL